LKRYPSFTATLRSSPDAALCNSGSAILPELLAGNQAPDGSRDRFAKYEDAQICLKIKELLALHQRLQDFFRLLASSLLLPPSANWMLVRLFGQRGEADR
jgi:hypothetical protein